MGSEENAAKDATHGTGSLDGSTKALLGDSFASQLTAIFILEFGIIFHSIFIGLTLAVSGTEFTTLYVVLVFHQTFEGLGLGSRLSAVPWPSNKRWTPYILGVCYSFSTPIAIAVGLGVRNTYAPGSQTALMVNGVFDSISAGILIYTGLVELMAHEFLFSQEMITASNGTVAQALVYMVLGAGKHSFDLVDDTARNSRSTGLMALLGNWA
jgi:solute carrier family 39 (zinc transporter), member 1/2/3